MCSVTAPAFLRPCHRGYSRALRLSSAQPRDKRPLPKAQYQLQPKSLRRAPTRGRLRPRALRRAGTRTQRRRAVGCGDNRERWVVPARLLRPGPRDAALRCRLAAQGSLTARRKPWLPGRGPLGHCNPVVTAVSVTAVGERESSERSVAAMWGRPRGGAGGVGGRPGPPRGLREPRRSAALQPPWPAPDLAARLRAGGLGPWREEGDRVGAQSI
nr:uncharacterized protein LOC129488382 [Symphalangus syndactylus]